MMYGKQKMDFQTKAIYYLVNGPLALVKALANTITLYPFTNIMKSESILETLWYRLIMNDFYRTHPDLDKE